MFNQILNTGKDIFVLKRVIREDRLKNPDMEILKQLYRAEILFRSEGLLYFCNKIDYVEYEECVEPKTKKEKKKNE